MQRKCAKHYNGGPVEVDRRQLNKSFHASLNMVRDRIIVVLRYLLYVELYQPCLAQNL